MRPALMSPPHPPLALPLPSFLCQMCTLLDSACHHSVKSDERKQSFYTTECLLSPFFFSPQARGSWGKRSLELSFFAISVSGSSPIPRSFCLCLRLSCLMLRSLARSRHPVHGPAQTVPPLCSAVSGLRRLCSKRLLLKRMQSSAK